MRALFVLGTFLAGSCEAFYTPGAVSRAVVTRASAIECHLRPRAVSYDPEFGDNTIARRQMLSSTANTPGPATRAGGSTTFNPHFGDNTISRRKQLSAYGNTPGPAAREEMTRDGSPTTFNPQFGDNTISRRKQLSAYGNTPGPATRTGGCHPYRWLHHLQPAVWGQHARASHEPQISQGLKWPAQEIFTIRDRWAAPMRCSRCPAKPWNILYRIV